MATNTLGEFSDGEDDFVFEIDENLWLNDEDDDNLIRNIDENEVLAGLYGNDDEDDDNLIRNIDENEVLAGLYGNDDDDDDDLIRNINEEEVLAQMGRGEKRKSDDEQDVEQGEYYYGIESVKKILLQKISHDSH